MAGARLESGKLFTGTSAERVALDTTHISGGDKFLESDTGNRLEWSGAAWYRANVAGHTDHWMRHAISVIEGNYGDEVSIELKNKDLLKFGHNKLVGTSPATVAHQPAGILHETYVTSNLITSIISDNAADTQAVKVEGHTTADGGLTFTFVVQEITLTGQTVATLSTPLARVSRVYNNNSTELVGSVYVTEDDTYTAGVPDTDAKVHLIIEAGEQQSEKAATTISNSDYWILTSCYADMLKKSAAFAEVELQIRLAGKVFRAQVIISCTDGGRGVHEFKPYLIAPKNADVRLVATASAAGTAISGGIQGVLATVL